MFKVFSLCLTFCYNGSLIRPLFSGGHAHRTCANAAFCISWHFVYQTRCCLAFFIYIFLCIFTGALLREYSPSLADLAFFIFIYALCYLLWCHLNFAFTRVWPYPFMTKLFKVSVSVVIWVHTFFADLVWRVCVCRWCHSCFMCPKRRVSTFCLCLSMRAISCALTGQSIHAALISSNRQYMRTFCSNKACSGIYAHLSFNPNLSTDQCKIRKTKLRKSKQATSGNNNCSH